MVWAESSLIHRGGLKSLMLPLNQPTPPTSCTLSFLAPHRQAACGDSPHTQSMTPRKSKPVSCPQRPGYALPRDRGTSDRG